MWYVACIVRHHSRSGIHMNHCSRLYALFIFSIKPVVHSIHPHFYWYTFRSPSPIVSVYDTSPVKMFGGFSHWSFQKLKVIFFLPTFWHLNSKIARKFLRKTKRRKHDLCEYLKDLLEIWQLVFALFDRRWMLCGFCSCFLSPSLSCTSVFAFVLWLCGDSFYLFENSIQPSAINSAGVLDAFTRRIQL